MIAANYIIAIIMMQVTPFQRNNRFLEFLGIFRHRNDKLTFLI